MPVLESLWQWFLGGLSTIVVGVGGVVKKNRDRSLQNRRQLQGDPDDPNAEGVLDIAHETREKVDNMEARMEREHREVMSKLDEISNVRYQSDEE